MHSPSRLIGATLVVSLLTTPAVAYDAVVLENVNVRLGPGTNYEVIGKYTKGDAIVVASCDYGWCKLDYGGQLGYVSQEFLDLAGPEIRTGGSPDEHTGKPGEAPK